MFSLPVSRVIYVHYCEEKQVILNFIVVMEDSVIFDESKFTHLN